jgi:hypothetical protein
MRLTKIASDPCPDKITCPGVFATDRGTIVVQGYVITDSEALAQLNLPNGETAVEIPLEMWANRGE